jgi:hypothetical protein
MADFRLAGLREEDFHDVEAYGDFGVGELFQVVECRFGQEAAFPRIDGCSGAGPTLGRPCFDLDEYETVTVAKDQVDLSAAGVEVGGEELQAEVEQVVFGQALAEFAAS